MNSSRRLVLSLLIAAILLFLSLLFWPVVVDNILRPTAMVLWLLLRIFVLSIHQQYFWYALIIAGVVVAFRMLPQEETDRPSDARQEMNATMINIGYWRGQFVYDSQNPQGQKNLRRQLAQLLTAFYASKQGMSSNFRIEEALQEGRLPLPRNIHAYVFPSEPPLPKGFLKRSFYAIRTTPRTWIRRWTGQEKAEHDQMIDDVLTFMETSLEIKHDDRNLSQNRH